MSPPSNNTGDPALIFDDAGVLRDGRPVWSQATFSVPAGGIVGVIGANGAGKTTLLQTVLGLVPTTSGSITVFGARPGEDNNSVGYVPQNYTSHADEALRVADAVMLGLNGRTWGLPRISASQHRRVSEALRSVHATDLAERRLSRLSGGQRQRVAIAAALVSRPKLLILDEPLASLDLGTQRDIVGLLRELHDELGVTILVAAHDLNPFLSILDSAIYFLDGRPRYDRIDRVTDEGLLSDLYGAPIEVALTSQGARYVRGVV